MAPIVSAMVRENIVEPVRVHQLECFEAGVLFAQTEGIIPAPETCHAIRGAIIEATRDLNEEKTILFNFLSRICGCSMDWTPETFVETTVQELKDKLVRELFDAAESSISKL